jgi:hypothetical protein
VKNNLRLSLAAAMFTFGAAAYAQAPEATPAAPTVPPAGAPSARSECRTQVDGKSLTGDQRKAAMHDCMKSHADACRTQAADKGMTKGPDRKAFMHQCMQGAA